MEKHTPPQVWVDAYNDHVAKAEVLDPPPTSIVLPAAILPPDVVRLILKLFDPDADV